MASRNVRVEKAVHALLARLDAFIGGEKVELPSPANRRVCDEMLAMPASTRVAGLFFSFYSLQDSSWDCVSVPTGVRGQFGDKLLSEQLTLRRITLHDNITAFGENLGWKGNVAAIKLKDNRRFTNFCAMLVKADARERRRVADYMASKFADSRMEQKPLPAVGADVLTFARAKELLTSLLALQTEGHVQQFIMAAMLSVHRARYGIEIRTHHPHAADKFDETAGDIEEWQEDRLVRAYEVTVRPDWKNRVSNFTQKMDRFKLSKYVIIAAGVNEDEQLAVPARLVAMLEPHGRDLAVVDIHDVAMVLAAELTADELRGAVNLAYDFLTQPHLCGRAEFQEMYRGVVDRWLDLATRAPGRPAPVAPAPARQTRLL